MRHPVSYLLYRVRSRIPKLLNSFMAASMLLNTFSPVMLLGDLGFSYDTLKGYKYYGEPRQVKSGLPAPELTFLDLGAPMGPELSAAPTPVIHSVLVEAPVVDSAFPADLGSSLSPTWLNTASDQPNLGSGVVPVWMDAANAAEEDMGSDLLPSWMSAPAADNPPPVSGDVGNCPPAANLDMSITVPPDPINRGDTTGEVYTVTVTNNDADAVDLVSFQIDPNQGFYFVGGSASATSDIDGAISVSNPGTTTPDTPFVINLTGTTPDDQLESGETITLFFTLATDGDAESGQQLFVYLRDGTNSPGTCQTAVENIQTVRGNLVIEKSPVTQDGTLGDTITWTVQLRNTGLGTVYDAIFADTIGSGYTGLSVNPSPANITLAPEESQDYEVSATIASCTNLTNTISANWSIGNSDGTATVGNPLTDEVDVVFLLEEPDISVEVGPLGNLNYCGTLAATVPVTVTNVGGAGRNLVLTIGQQNVDSVTELSPDWIKSGNTFVYQGGSPSGTILPGEVLTFDMNVQVTSAACVNQDVSVSLTPSFYDACLLLLDSAAAGTSPVTTVSDAATLSVDKEGPAVIAAGDTFVYTVTVSGVNQDSIDPGGVTVTDTVPTVLTITNVTATTGSPTTVGNIITWNLPLAGAGAYNEVMYITVEVPEEGGGVCDAGTTFTNDVEAFADVCPECTPLSSSDSVTTQVEDYLGTNNAFTKTVSTVEMCDTGASQVITAVLTIRDGITWTNTIYTDTLGQGVFALPLNVTSWDVEIDGVDRSADVVTSVGPPLVIDFSGIGTFSNTADITITYNVTAAVNSTVGDAASQSAFLFSEFEMGGTMDACAGGAVGYVGATYNIYRGDLGLSATPGTIQNCGVSTVTLNVTGAAANSLTDNLVVTFTAQAGDVFTHTDAVFGGAFAAASVISDRVGATATFTFPAGLEIDSGGTIEFPMYRDCNLSGPVTSGVTYQDRCNVVRTAGGSATSSSQISDVNLFTTPDQYVVNSKSAIWRFYVSSIGQIAAEDLIVTNTLPVGHKFITYTVSSTSAPTNVVSMVTGTVGGQEVITFTISSLPVGGRLQFDMESEIDSACNLPAQIDIALWDDCGGVGGACFGRETGIVRLLPGPYFLLTSNDQVATLPLCTQGPLKLVVKNTSASAPEHQFNITDVLTNATYVNGTAFVTVTDVTDAIVTGTTSGQSLANVPFTPTVNTVGQVQTLTWRDGDFASGTPQYDVLVERAASDVIEIDMELQTTCSGTGAMVQSFVDAVDVCTQPLSSEENAQTLDVSTPELSATKIGYNADTENPGDADDEVYASNGDTVVWQIDVTNDGDAHVTNLFVTDTVPADFTITSVSSGGSFVGSTATWGSAGGLTLNVNETKSFIITGTIDGNTCALNRTNTALASYGCSTTDVCLGTPVSTNAATLQTQPNITAVDSSGTLSQCDGTIQIDIVNDGPPAQNVVFTDTLPAEYVYDGFVSATTAPATTPSLGDAVITFTWNALPEGTTTVIFDVRNANSSGACTTPAASVTNNMDTYYEDTCTAPTASFTRSDSDSHTVQTPQLQAVKTPVSQVSDVGNTVTWDLYVNNTGNAVAPNVVITDVVSTNFSNVTGTVSTVTGGGSNTPSLPGANTVAWTTPITIPVGGTWHAVVTADLLSSGNNTDTMTAVGTCGSGCVFATSNDIAYVTLLEEFDKGPEVQTDTIGAQVVFTFTTGLSDQDGLYEGITLTDTLPTGLGYISAELDYTEDGDGNSGGPTTTSGVTPTITPGLYTTGDIIWQLGDVNGTVQVNGVITAVIQDNLQTNHGDRKVNNIDLSYTQDTQYYTFTDNANVDIVEPFLTILKDVEPLDAEPLDTVYYTITLYHEPSPVPVVSAYNVFITDVIPAELTYNIGSFTQVSGPAADTVDATGAPTLGAYWTEVPTTVTQGNPIRLRYTATVNEDAPVGEAYTNVVTTTWTSLPDNPYGETRDGDGGNGGADDYIASDPAIIGLSEVWLNKTAPLSITAGTNITYNIYVTNDGPFTATSAIVTDTMPFQINTLSAVYNVPGGNNGNCVITSGTPDIVVCSLGDILDDVTAAITVVASVPAEVPEAADLTNSAYVTVTSEDGDDTNNDDTEETEVYTEADNDLSKTCTTPVTAGETVVCEVVLENLGPSVSRDVDIKDILPEGFTWVSGTATQGTCVNGICQYGDVDVNEVITATITATVGSDISGAYTNEAEVFADTPDPDAANNTDTAPITVNTLTALQIAKVDLTDPVYAGQTYLYEIVITNTGPSDAQNVVITDDLPAEVTFEGASPACSHAAGTVTCDLGTLAANERRDFLINVRVDSAVVSGTVGTNDTAVTTTTTIDVGNSTLSDSEDTTYLQDTGGEADLEITKSVSPATRIAGDGQFTYVYTVTNNGPAPASAVQVVDAFPREFDFVSATASDSSTCNSGSTCDLGVMINGATVVITLVVDVPADAAAGTYTNTAYVGSATTESTYANNEDSVTSTVSNNADLQIRKIANPSPATPGEDLEYTLVVTNTGQSNAANVTVSDPLPADFSLDFVLSSQGGCASLPCNLGTLAPNETATIWINGTVNANAAGNLNNTATVTSTTSGSGDNDSTSTPLSGGVDLALVKTATPTVYAGEDIDYNLTVYNQGSADVTNATVTDTLPVSVTFSSASPGCSHASGVVTCGTFNLSAGANTSYTITVTTDDDIVPGSSLENTAIVGSPTPETDVENNQDDADTSILGRADLELDKTAPATVTAGQQIAYTLVITNTGPSTARSVDVKDLLPTGLTFESASTTQGFCVPGLCQFGDIAVNGVVTVVITATVGSEVTGSLDNIAQVFADTEDPDPANDSDNAVTTVNTSADVGVTKVDLMDPVAPDSTLIYELVVTNDGPSDAANVVVTDGLDSNVTFVNASPDCSLSGSNVVCTVGTLVANSSVDYLISVQVSDSAPSGTLLTNNITVTTTTTDPNSSNDTDSITTTVQQDLGLPVDLGITKSDNPGTVVAGEIVTYTLTITNDGPEIATNVRVLELVPTGTTVQSVSVTNPDFVGEHCSQGGACFLGTIFTDTTATIVMALQVDDDYGVGTINNSASVASDQQDSDPSDNIATEDTTVTTSVDLTIQKNDLMDPVNAGEYILYQITITNTGSSAADNVIITDSVPVSTTFVGASPLCVESGGLITCSLSTLNAGERASVWVQVQTDDRLADGSTVNNTAYVSSDTTETDDTNNSEPEDTTVNQPVLGPTDLEIAKSGDPVAVIAGETLTYTLVVTNNGPAQATNVLVVDALPDGVTFVSATASQGLCNAGVTCDLTNLAVGATATVEVVVTVDSDQTAGLLNVARVSAANPESDLSNNEATLNTPVSAVADLEIVKDGPATATPGGTIEYEITVSNNGPSDAQSVVVTDTIPTGLSSATASSSQGTCSIAAGVLDCNIGTLAVGASATIALNAAVDADVTADIGNTANAGSPTDPTGVIDASDTTTATISSSADLALDVGSTPTATAGETVTVTYTVYNSGPSDAENVVITATFPTEVTPPVGWNLVSGRTYTYSVGTVPAGGSTTVTENLPLDSDIEPGTSVEFPGEVGATTPDPNADNNLDDADTSVVGEADLGLTKTGSATATAGETVQYTIVITNGGPSTAKSVDLKDLLPQGVNFQSYTTTSGFCVSGLCQFGDVTVSDIITVVITGTVDSDVVGNITNEAEVFAYTDDPDPSNNNDDHDTLVGAAADLRVAKVDLQDPAPSASGLIYELIVINDGPSDALNVFVTDTLSSDVTFAGASYGCTHDGSGTNGDVVCDVGTLAAGQLPNIWFRSKSATFLPGR